MFCIAFTYSLYVTHNTHNGTSYTPEGISGAHYDNRGLTVEDALHLATHPRVIKRYRIMYIKLLPIET
jgi:hypothetical protein